MLDTILEQLYKDLDREAQRLKDVRLGVDLLAKLIREYEERSSKQHSQPLSEESRTESAASSDQAQ